MGIKETMVKPYGMTSKMLPQGNRKNPLFTCLENTKFFLEYKRNLHWSGSLCGSHQVQLLAPSRKNFCHCTILLMAVFSQALNISLQDLDPTSLNEQFCFQLS